MIRDHDFGFADNRMETGGSFVAPITYARRYLDRSGADAHLEAVPGADHGWGTVPHRTRLHRSTLEFLREHLEPADHA